MSSHSSRSYPFQMYLPHGHRLGWALLFQQLPRYWTISLPHNLVLPRETNASRDKRLFKKGHVHFGLFAWREWKRRAGSEVQSAPLLPIDSWGATMRWRSSALIEANSFATSMRRPRTRTETVARLQTTDESIVSKTVACSPSSLGPSFHSSLRMRQASEPVTTTC